MIPVKIKKAIEVLQGYCEKHRRCDGCPLDDFCSNKKNKAPVDWLEQEAEHETTDR